MIISPSSQQKSCHKYDSLICSWLFSDSCVKKISVLLLDIFHVYVKLLGLLPVLVIDVNVF